MDILTLAIAKNKFGSANETITTENITNALGYKPANQEDLRKLSEEKVNEKYQYQTLYMKSPNGTVYSVKIDDNGNLYVDGVVPDEEVPEDLLEGRLLVWSDEFEGDYVDSSKWFFRMDNASYYDDVVVSNSVLDMPVHYDSENSRWTSYYMLTSGLEDVKYGRIEAKMKWDKGIFTAFWTVGQTSQKYNGVTEGIIWPRAGEIDIFESATGENIFITLHYGENEGANIAHDAIKVNANYAGVDFSEWHIFALEWTETEMVFYVDDVEVGRQDITGIVYEDGTNPFNNPHYIIISCHRGENGSEEAEPVHMYTDWVRYYAPVGITEKIPIESISLSESSISLNPNRVRELELTIEPDYVTDYTMRWYSTDRSVAKFNAGNRIETLKEGNVELSVVTKDGLTAKCDLTVSNDVVNNVTGIELDYGAINVGYVGGTITITATVSPKWATYLDCDWESSDTNVATVENGVVLFVGDGNVTITAKAKDTSNVTASVNLISKSNLTDNIDMDGCVVKFTKKGWDSEKSTSGVETAVWNSDLENVTPMTSNGGYFRYSQGEGMYFTSNTSPLETNYTVVNIDTAEDFTICERIKIKAGTKVNNGGHIFMLCDSEIMGTTTGTTLKPPLLFLGLHTTGNWTLRWQNQIDNAYVINQYSKTPTVFSVDENSLTTEEITLNFVVTHTAGGQWKFYNNGVLLAEGTDSVTAEVIGNPVLCVGSYPAKGRQQSENFLYQGLLAYNKALTTDEVTALNTALDEMYA